MASGLSIKSRLLALAALALVGVVALAALAIGSQRVSQRALTGLYEQDIESLLRLQRIENSLLEVRFRAAGVLLDQLPVQGSLNHVREARTEIGKLWGELEPRATRAFVAGDAATALKDLQQGWPLVDTTLAKLEKGYAAKDKAALSAVLEDDWATLHKAAVKPIQALIPITQAAAAASYASAIDGSQTMLGIGVATALVCLTGLALVAWLTMRSMLGPLNAVEQSMRAIAGGDLSQPLPAPRHDELGRMIDALAQMQQRLLDLVGDVRRSTESITTASGEIAAGTQDLSQRTERAASSLQQTASAMQELTGTVRHSAEAAGQARTLAASAADVAGRGGAVVQQVVATMGEISASAKRIADITGVIDGIAFQTNILALNAAVEAARAGDQGRGFAVVAAEVRSLAQRSAAAAKEIKALIGGSVEKVETGSRLVADAGTTMTDIVASVQRVAEMIGDITHAAAAQSDGIGGVNSAVSQLDQMTQQNAALVEQSAAASESLKDQARRLAQTVGSFTLA